MEGKHVILFCSNYIYTGILVSLTHDTVVLSEPYIVYETGPFDAPKWKDAQRLPVDEHRIERSALESMGVLNMAKTP